MTSIVGTGLEGYIKRNARERALNRLAEAEIEARRIIERAERRAAQVRAESGALAAEMSESTRQRTLAQASLDAQTVRVRGREVVLRRVWQQAQERLAGLLSGERLAAIQALTRDAAEQLGGGALVLQVNAADAAQLDQATIAAWQKALEPLGVTALTVDSQPARILGGVLVRRIASQSDELGAQRLVDNSWDQRLRLSYDVLRPEVYASLGEPANPANSSQGSLP